MCAIQFFRNRLFVQFLVGVVYRQLPSLAHYVPRASGDRGVWISELEEAIFLGQFWCLAIEIELKKLLSIHSLIDAAEDISFKQISSLAKRTWAEALGIKSLPDCTPRSNASWVDKATTCCASDCWNAEDRNGGFRIGRSIRSSVCCRVACNNSLCGLSISGMFACVIIHINAN